MPGPCFVRLFPTLGRWREVPGWISPARRSPPRPASPLPAWPGLCYDFHSAPGGFPLLLDGLRGLSNIAVNAFIFGFCFGRDSSEAFASGRSAGGAGFDFSGPWFGCLLRPSPARDAFPASLHPTGCRMCGVDHLRFSIAGWIGTFHRLSISSGLVRSPSVRPGHLPLGMRKRKARLLPGLLVHFQDDAVLGLSGGAGGGSAAVSGRDS